MRLLLWLFKTLCGLFGNDTSEDATAPRSVELSVTRLEPRVVLNASPVVALFGADGVESVEVAEPDTIAIDAGDDANDGEADEFRLTTDGSRFHIDVNDQRVYSGHVDDSVDLTLHGSDDADPVSYTHLTLPTKA